MHRKTIKHVKNPGYELLAFVEAGRCDADGYYWCIKIDGDTCADGYSTTTEDAEAACLEEIEAVQH